MPENGVCVVITRKRQKITKLCVRKKSHYCCFGSKLSRIFHEQGRPQIDKGWGSAENPDCSSFNINDFSRLDFSKMDLSEAFAEIFNNVKNVFKKALPRQMKDQMPKVQKDIDKIKEANRKSWDDDSVTRKTF